MRNRNQAILQVEQLEDRRVPSANGRNGPPAPPTPSTPPTVDLSVVDAHGQVGAALFGQADSDAVRNQNFKAFVRLQHHGDKTGIEQGFNSNFHQVQFDEKKDRIHTRALKLSDIPIVTINGVDYRQLLLAVNQKASQPYISLDELRIYLGETDDLTDYDSTAHTLGGLDPVYDLDEGSDSWVKINANLNRGHAAGDVFLFVPDSLFSTSPDGYVYLYSKFGVNIGANAGFEAWKVGKEAVEAPADMFPPLVGTISGFVLDTNSQAALANVVIFLDENTNGTLDSGEVSTTTDPAGHFAFENLAMGDYHVWEVIPPDYDPFNHLNRDVTLDAGHPDAVLETFFNTPFDPNAGGSGGS